MATRRNPKAPAVARPRVVTAAVALIAVYAVAAGLPPILFLLFGPDLAAVLERGAPTFGGYVSERESAVVAGVTVALSVVIMLGFGLLAYRLGRGRGGARLATWIIGGLFTLCNFAGLQSVAALLREDGSGGVPTAAQLGVHVTDLVTAVVQLLSLLVALILLALPAAGAYFRRMDVWVPPAGYRGPAPSAEPGVAPMRPAPEGATPDSGDPA